VRSFTVGFLTGDWYVENIESAYGDIFETEAVFAHFRASNGKIVYLHDFGWVHEKSLEAVQNEPIYQEVCEFIFDDKSIVGSFCTALVEIKKELHLLNSKGTNNGRVIWCCYFWYVL